MNNQDEQQLEQKFDEQQIDEQKFNSLEQYDPSQYLNLISKDGVDHLVSKNYALTSELVKQALDSDVDATEIHMPGVSNSTLKVIIEYMNHHTGNELPIITKPLKSKIMVDVCKDPWDAEFVDRIGETRQDLYDLILAANYMDIKSLLHLGCAKVASLIKGQPLEKIKDILEAK